MGTGKPAPIIFALFRSVKIPPLPAGCAALAQLVEHLTRNEKVWGSIPQGGSFYISRVSYFEYFNYFCYSLCLETKSGP